MQYKEEKKEWLSYCQHEYLIPIKYIITLFIADVVAYI